jgi:hypothetical protein
LIVRWRNVEKPKYAKRRTFRKTVNFTRQIAGPCQVKFFQRRQLALLPKRSQKPNTSFQQYIGLLSPLSSICGRLTINTELIRYPRGHPRIHRPPSDIKQVVPKAALFRRISRANSSPCSAYCLTSSFSASLYIELAVKEIRLRRRTARGQLSQSGVKVSPAWAPNTPTQVGCLMQMQTV